MDQATSNPSENNNILLQISIKGRIYMFLAVTFVLIIFSLFFFSDILTGFGVALLVFYFAALVFAVSVFKTIKVYSNRMEIKYVVGGKKLHYHFSEISEYLAYETTESFTKMYIVKFMAGSKQQVFGSFLYGKKEIDTLNQIITKALSENQYI